MRTFWCKGVAFSSLVTMGCLPPFPEFNLDSASASIDEYRVSIDPETPTSEQVLTAIVSGSSAPSGEFVSALTYEWTVNGEVRGGNERTLVGDKYFERGDEIQVKVSDFPFGGPDIQSEPISVINAQPTTPTITLDWLNRCGTLLFNDYTTIELPSYSNFDFSHNMTIESWFYWGDQSSSPETQLLFGQWNETDFAFQLQLTPAGLFELFTQDGRNFESTDVLPVVPTSFHHVALVYNHPYWRIYLNGTEVLFNTSNNDIPLPKQQDMPLYFGMSPIDDTGYLKGGFHSIRASHMVHYSEDFSQHINELVFRPQPEDAGLWYFAPAPSDGQSTMLDLSGNGNDLEVGSGTWDETCPMDVVDIRCALEDLSFDADHDELIYQFTWTLDDIPTEASFQTPMSQDLYQEQLYGVENVKCQVQASDGQPSENHQSGIAEEVMILDEG